MSQLQGVSEKIGEREFEVFPMRPKKARAHILRLNQIVLPLIGRLKESASDDPKGEEAPVPWGALAEMLVEKADPDYIEKLMDDLAEVTICAPGGPLHKAYDVIFAGHPGHQVAWFQHAFKVQFENFIEESGLGSNLGALSATMASGSQSTSTGGDTA